MSPHCFSFYTKDKKINNKEEERREKRKEREEKEKDDKGAARERQYLCSCTPVAVTKKVCSPCLSRSNTSSCLKSLRAQVV
jgi:hypothetical protein